MLASARLFASGVMKKVSAYCRYAIGSKPKEVAVATILTLTAVGTGVGLSGQDDVLVGALLGDVVEVKVESVPRQGLDKSKWKTFKKSDSLEFGMKGYTASSVTVWVKDGDIYKELPVHDFDLHTITNETAYFNDLENVEPIYETVKIRTFTKYFGSVDLTDSGQVATAVENYLTKEHGYKF